MNQIDFRRFPRAKSDVLSVLVTICPEGTCYHDACKVPKDEQDLTPYEIKLLASVFRQMREDGIKNILVK